MENKNIEVIERIKQVKVDNEEKTIVIENRKLNLNIIIDESKPSTIKIEFGNKIEAIKIEKLKDDQVLEIFPAPDSIKINNVTRKDKKNITPEADKSKNPPKPPVNFTFEKIRAEI
jgi:hypothetical protein